MRKKNKKFLENKKKDFMENPKKEILPGFIFYNESEFDIVPTQYNGEFSNQKTYPNSLKDNTIFKERSKWLKGRGLTKKRFEELSKEDPEKLAQVFIDLEIFTEKLQLQQPSSYLTDFKELNKYYVKVVEKFRNRLFKENYNSTSSKKKLWLHMYRFSELKAPIPKISKIELKYGKVKKIIIPEKLYMMETDDFFDKFKKKLTKKPLVLLDEVKDPTQGLQKQRPQDLESEKAWHSEIQKVWAAFKNERKIFEKKENNDLAVLLLVRILTAFQNLKKKNKENQIYAESLKVAALWDLVVDSVIEHWHIFLQKEFYDKEEKYKYDRKKRYKKFPQFKNEVVITNYKKLLPDLIDQQERFTDFNSFLNTAISKLLSLKEEKVNNLGKRAVLEERLNYISEPLLTALLDSKCLIIENREERDVKDYKGGEFLPLE